MFEVLNECLLEEQLRRVFEVLYECIHNGYLFGFHGISNFIGYLMPDQFLYK